MGCMNDRSFRDVDSNIGTSTNNSSNKFILFLTHIHIKNEAHLINQFFLSHIQRIKHHLLSLKYEPFGPINGTIRTRYCKYNRLSH